MPRVQLASGDRTTPLVREPAYQQLAQRLRALVREGECRPGDRFPTERQVAERFKVSRVTANKALAGLVSEGVLEFRKGVGTFVRDPGMHYDLRALISFTRKAQLDGRRAGTRVLRFHSTCAGKVPVFARKALGVGSDEPLYYVERLRLADGVPLILERRLLVARWCPGLSRKQLEGSLYTLLTGRYGRRLTSSHQCLRAAAAARSDARLLGLRPGGAVLWVRATGECQHGPLWIEDTLYRGDRYEFFNVIGSDPVSQPARPALAADALPELLFAP